MLWMDEMIRLYTPWIVWLGLIFTFVRLLSWARNKKTGAFIFAVFMQMMLPDPYAERTIRVVQQENKKKEIKGSQKNTNENGEPLDEPLE